MGDTKFKKELVQAVQLVEDFCSQNNGPKLFGIANIVYMLEQESFLSNDEILRLTERIYEATYSSAAPLLTSERLDAVLYLLENGITNYRFPDLPQATPDQIKEFLLTCDYEIFIDLVEKVAVDNQTFYLPDDIGVEREEAVNNAFLEFIAKKPELESVIDSAKEQGKSTQNVAPTLEKNIKER